jgi:hypothetical protein
MARGALLVELLDILGRQATISSAANNVPTFS